ncbi:prepilin-type N-terminal cleavage/methylation domain-containing protein [Candidatus Riflebacteria bacterium]
MFDKRMQKKSFTLIELLIVVGIIGVVITITLFYYFNSRKTKDKISKAQKLALVETLMFARLRKDIRSTISLKKNKRSYTLQIYSESKKGTTEIETVVWKVSSDKKKIFRQGKQRKVYDFSKLQDKTIFFNIQ